MITGAGAKLLDFGVSKSHPSAGVPALATVVPPDAPLTADGALLGTFLYMAPEQLEGRSADVRSDTGISRTRFTTVTTQRIGPF